jgi:hypothetical protein
LVQPPPPALIVGLRFPSRARGPYWVGDVNRTRTATALVEGREAAAGLRSTVRGPSLKQQIKRGVHKIRSPSNPRQVQTEPRGDQTGCADRRISALASNLPGRLTAGTVLCTYERQSHLERRHCDLKQTRKVRPIFPHSDERITALVSVVGLALLTFGLIEAGLRNASTLTTIYPDGSPRPRSPCDRMQHPRRRLRPRPHLHRRRHPPRSPHPNPTPHPRTTQNPAPWRRATTTSPHQLRKMELTKLFFREVRGAVARNLLREPRFDQAADLDFAIAGGADH